MCDQSSVVNYAQKWSNSMDCVAHYEVIIRGGEGSKAHEGENWRLARRGDVPFPFLHPGSRL